jgi:hypothetical protein
MLGVPLGIMGLIRCYFANFSGHDAAYMNMCTAITKKMLWDPALLQVLQSPAHPHPCNYYALSRTKRNLYTTCFLT